jgi:hypothetical protein
MKYDNDVCTNDALNFMWTCLTLFWWITVVAGCYVNSVNLA